MNIEKAEPKDSAVLTRITKESKAFWGYSSEQLSAWESELTISDRYIAENSVYKMVSNDTITGYYAYLALNGSTVILDNLFVAPAFIRKGFGSALMNDFLNRMKQLDIIEIQLDADPNAEAFYARFGFEKIGETKTSIPNRFLPKMRLIMT